MGKVLFGGRGHVFLVGKVTFTLPMTLPTRFVTLRTKNMAPTKSMNLVDKVTNLVGKAPWLEPKSPGLETQVGGRMGALSEDDQGWRGERTAEQQEDRVPKSKHSVVKQSYQRTETYPPAHWVPHHQETCALNSKS